VSWPLPGRGHPGLRRETEYWPLRGQIATLCLGVGYRRIVPAMSGCLPLSTVILMLMPFIEGANFHLGDVFVLAHNMNLSFYIGLLVVLFMVAMH